MRWRALAWLMFVALCAHNLEEGLTARWYWENRSPDWLPLPRWFAQSYLDLFPAALVAVTALGFAAIGIATWWDRPGLAGTLAVIMLVNVVVPHVPLALLSGGYAPGVFTALALNLPICGALLLRLRRDGLIGRGARQDVKLIRRLPDGT